MALLVIALALTISSMASGLFILEILGAVPLGLCVYRSFSKDVTKRAAENRGFLALWYKFTRFFKNFKKNARERRAYSFFKCPKCAQKVRVPKGKGAVNIKCPKCGEKFLRKT